MSRVSDPREDIAMGSGPGGYTATTGVENFPLLDDDAVEAAPAGDVKRLTGSDGTVRLSCRGARRASPARTR